MVESELILESITFVILNFLATKKKSLKRFSSNLQGSEHFINILNNNYFVDNKKIVDGCCLPFNKRRIYYVNVMYISIVFCC